MNRRPMKKRDRVTISKNRKKEMPVPAVHRGCDVTSVYSIVFE